MLEARHLTKRFFGVAAVKDVTLAIRAGEVLGYLGPNGSGKTTTVRMVTGQMPPSGGSVLFLGRPIELVSMEFRQRLGYVPEEAHLYTFLSGRGYLQLIGGLRGITTSLLNEKIDSLAGLFGVREALDQDISAYSKGMKQKILISAALIHDPDVLVFDEPEAGLDVTTALVLRHLMRTLASRGKAILYSSHILEVVEAVCTRVVVLHQGCVVADDSLIHLRTVTSRSSLTEVFSDLVLKIDPESTAREIADVIALRS